MPRALIADDEAHLAEYLKTLLATCWPELKIEAIALNGVDALRIIDEQAPEIAFLDIRMPGLTGLDIAAKLVGVAHAPLIVFVTAYDQYAVNAFEQEAVDYLLKPPNLARLQKTVDKLKAALTKPAQGSLDDSSKLLARLAAALDQRPATASRLTWIKAAQGNETRLIAIDEVVYFQANDKYISVFTETEECLIRTPLKELLEGLDADRFWQVHRGTVVAVQQIASTAKDFRGRTLLKLKTRAETLVVSRAYLNLFKQM